MNALHVFNLRNTVLFTLSDDVLPEAPISILIKTPREETLDSDLDPGESPSSFTLSSQSEPEHLELFLALNLVTLLRRGVLRIARTATTMTSVLLRQHPRWRPIHLNRRKARRDRHPQLVRKRISILEESAVTSIQGSVALLYPMTSIIQRIKGTIVATQSLETSSKRGPDTPFT